jgi:hypothetical protein
MRIVPVDRSHPLADLWYGSRAIGASAAEVVMKGKGKYQTEHQLWSYITRRMEKEPQTEPMLAGLAME